MRKMSLDCARRDGKAMGVTDDKYPQLLGGIKIVNAPKWMEVPWKIVRPLFSKRVIEKMDFINPMKNRKDLKTLHKYISLEHLPTRYGGKNQSWPPKFD